MPFFRHLLIGLLLLAGTPLAASAQSSDAAWLYRGSDIAPDPAWTFGTLANGMRYAVRRNALPAGQVSIRLRIDAGALHEADSEQGWAHFTEHMVFRGTKSFADREARQLWQRLGASFGSDTNATTSHSQTVYQLDLPRADRASLDTSLHILAEMADSALFDPATVEAERRVILAEKGRQPELNIRYGDASRALFFAGLKYADRDIIGTDATLAAATAAPLRAFYERWYRPDRATLVVVGDADPAMLEQLIAARFGDWRPSGPAPAEPDYGAIAEVPARAVSLAYPGAPLVASVNWVRPYRELPNTLAREQADFATSIAERILARRLEARARGGDAPFVSAGGGRSRSTDIADVTQLSITARDGKWREALAETYAIVADALRAPPSEAEIARELQNLRLSAASAVEGEATVKSPSRANQLISAIDGNSVVATAATSLRMMDGFAPLMTPGLVGQAMRDMFTGEGPRLLLLSPTPIASAELDRALAAAEAAAPAARQADRLVTFDSLPTLGPPGRELSRERIEDMDATIVRFANGASLIFKQTDFEKGSVGVQLRFGNGYAGLPRDDRALAWLSGLVWPSGLADLDLDALERLLTGRRMAMSFGAGEDAFELRGATNGADLEDQLRLMAVKLAFPRWDEAMLQRFKASALEGYDLGFSSAAARARRESPGFTRGGDPRWRPVEKQEIAGVTLADFEGFYAPLLAAGPIEAIIVGDVDIETAVAAMARTIGALPARAAPAPVNGDVRPPAPSPEPRRFTHQGDRAQAYAMIGWNTFGGAERQKERRALTLAANIFRVRLFDELRELEGASYAPTASSTNSETFPELGIFYASAELRPESVDTFLRIARAIVADLAANAVSPDEYARAHNPVLTGIERQLKTNGYWLGAMENWTRDPRQIEQTRSLVSQYRAMTAEDVRAAVAEHFADGGDWSMLILPAKATGGAE